MSGEREVRLRRGSRTGEVLKILALVSGVVILGGFVRPGVIVKDIIKFYEKKKRFERYKLLRDLRSLQKRKLVDFKEFDDGRIKMVLTKEGKRKALEFQIDGIKLNTNKKWDGKWRMVIFDIPVYKNRARIALQKKLTDLGFYSLQKSVFITPYPCEDEIDFIASVFNVRGHILILYVSGFEGDEKLKKYFKV